MANYQEFLSRAVDALPENNSASRREVYEKARKALVTQLRAINPPLPAREITQIRLELEDVIREVEHQATEEMLGGLQADDLITELEELMRDDATLDNFESDAKEADKERAAKDVEIQDTKTNEIKLVQRPAAFGFGVRNNKLSAYPQSGEGVSTELMAQILPIVLEKSRAYQAAMKAHGNAPETVRANAEKLVSSLEDWSETPQPGVLLMRLRSLEADISAYDTVAGRNELYPSAIAAMLDLKGSIDDLLGMDPFVQKIQANALALEIQSADIEEIEARLSELEIAAQQSDVVDNSVVQALEEGKASVEADGEIIRTTLDHDKKSEAIARQSKQTGMRVMTARNFGAEIVRASQDGVIKGVKSGVSGFVSGGIKTGCAALVSLVAGPFAALGVFVASLKSLGDKTKKIAEDDQDASEDE